MPRFQFSLRTLLLTTAVVALPLSWWSWKAERQRRAVAELRKSGAYIVYNIPSVAATKNTHRAEGVPPFVDWRYKPIQVSLYQPPSDDDMAALQELDELECVSTYTVLNEDDVHRLKTAIPKCRVEISLFHSWPP